MAQYQMLPYLAYEGAGHLDAVFVTHSDADHISGIMGLMEECGETGIKIGCLYLPDLAKESRDENYLELAALAQGCGIPVRLLHEGERLQSGKLMLTCMHPDKSYVNSDANAGSIVLYLTYETFRPSLRGIWKGKASAL